MNKFAKYVPEEDKKKQCEYIGAVSAGEPRVEVISILPETIIAMTAMEDTTFSFNTDTIYINGDALYSGGDTLYITFDGVQYTFPYMNESTDESKYKLRLGLFPNAEGDIPFTNGLRCLELTHSAKNDNGYMSMYAETTSDETHTLKIELERTVYDSIDSSYLPLAGNYRRGIISYLDIVKNVSYDASIVVGETTKAEVTALRKMITDKVKASILKLTIKTRREDNPLFFDDVTFLIMGDTASGGSTTYGSYIEFSGFEYGNSYPDLWPASVSVYWVKNDDGEDVVGGYVLEYPTRFRMAPSILNESQFEITVTENGTLKVTKIK